MVFTIVDTVTAEFQDDVSSASQPHSKGILKGMGNDNLTVDISPGETQIVRPAVSSENESLTNNEETTENLSILEDTVEDKTFEETGQLYVVRAEPKVIEMQLKVQEETPESMLEEKDSANILETAAVINDSVKDAEDMKGVDLKLSHPEDSEQAPAPQHITYNEWTQKRQAEAEKKTSEYATVL
jgi:hypothetical protein